mmetsp:Transcript_7560/g.10439  ORF Transcript_7560/g.10439 Transcript_7560/m.10439 type:complete len:224 (-) Transcript_7560:138-809(-)
MNEENELELEALRAIYMDDIEEISKDPIQFQINLQPNAGSDDNHVSLTLDVTFTSRYPNEAPICQLTNLYNIDETQEKQIEEIIKQQINENLGMAMIYNVACACKSWLDDNNISPEQKKKLKLQKEEEEIQKRRSEGTPVTIESFAAWKEKFYAKYREEEKRKEEERKKKLTGRQLFESNLDLVSSEKDFVDEGEAVEVDWSIFSKELDEQFVDSVNINDEND